MKGYQAGLSGGMMWNFISPHSCKWEGWKLGIGPIKSIEVWFGFDNNAMLDLGLVQQEPDLSTSPLTNWIKGEILD